MVLPPTPSPPTPSPLLPPLLLPPPLLPPPPPPPPFPLPQIPVTREVLASLPNILSALCLNARGLQVFINAKPFDHLFGVLISPDYLPAMRKKKGADQIGDTASNLGVAMDELMRHQPTLRSNVISALIRVGIPSACASSLLNSIYSVLQVASLASLALATAPLLCPCEPGTVHYSSPCSDIVSSPPALSLARSNIAHYSDSPSALCVSVSVKEK